MPSKVWYQHIEAWTKCPPFLRLHLHRYLLEWQLFDYNWNFRVFVCFFRDGHFFFSWIYEYNLVSTGWVNGLALSRPQGTTWTSDDRDQGRQMVSLSHTLTERFMGPPWGPSRAGRSQVGPMLAPWTSLYGQWLRQFFYPPERIIQIFIHTLFWMDTIKYICFIYYVTTCQNYLMTRSWGHTLQQLTIVINKMHQMFSIVWLRSRSGFYFPGHNS